MLFVLKVLAFILSPVLPGVDTFAMHLTLLPVPFVPPAIAPFVDALIK
jgi:hypothetical protein